MLGNQETLQKSEFNTLGCHLILYSTVETGGFLTPVYPYLSGFSYYFRILII